MRAGTSTGGEDAGASTGAPTGAPTRHDHHSCTITGGTPTGGGPGAPRPRFATSGTSRRREGRKFRTRTRGPRAGRTGIVSSQKLSPPVGIAGHANYRQEKEETYVLPTHFSKEIRVCSYEGKSKSSLWLLGAVVYDGI